MFSCLGGFYDFVPDHHADRIPILMTTGDCIEEGTAGGQGIWQSAHGGMYDERILMIWRNGPERRR